MANNTGGIRRYCGIVEETEYGQDPAPSAHVHLDIASSSLDSPSDPHIIYGGGARRSARIYRPGFYSPSGNIVYGLDVRTIGWFLKWALGDYDFTALGGSNGNNLHEIWGTHDVILPSFCARIGKDIFEHVFSGCVVNSLEINVGDALCMATVDVAAKKDAKSALETGELSFPEEYPIAFHEVNAYLIENGSETDIGARIKEMTLSITNNADASAGRHVGNMHPARVPVGDRETTLSMTLFHENTDFLEKFWGNSTGPDECGPTEFGLKLVIDTSPCETHGKLEILLPKVISTSTQQQPSGRDEMDQPVEVRALFDMVTLDDGSDEESEILCSLENDEDEMEEIGT